MRVCFDFTIRDARKLLYGLLLIEICLVLAYAFVNIVGFPSLNFIWFVNLDEEGNFPAWFSAMQLFMIGLVFLLNSRLRKPREVPSAWFFRTVGAAFIFLSADEAAKVHENLHFVLASIFKGDASYWIYFYAVIAVALVLVFHRSMIAMAKQYRRESHLMAVGLVVIILGAVVLETVSFMFLRSGSTPGWYLIEVAVEEFLEMFGCSIVLYGAVLLLLRDATPDNPVMD